MASAATFQPGDVLLFTSDDSHIDHIICLLTKSDVAHSAIYYGNDLLVDAAVRCGIAGHEMQVLPSGPAAPDGKTSPPWAQRDIYVHRLKSPPPPPPVFEAARRYAGENDRFNFPGLIQVGLHLLFREGPRPLVILRLIGELFEMLTSELGNLHPQPGTGKKGPHPMYCSQFVCQCFADAGCPLHIDKPKTLAPSTMLDWIVRGSASFAPEPGPAKAPRPENRTFDDVIAELDKELTNAKSPDESFAAASGSPPRDLIQATNDFGEALQRLQEPDGSKGKLSGLSYLRKLQNDYVTPGDLHERCSDLRDIGGTYRIRRNADVHDLP